MIKRFNRQLIISLAIIVAALAVGGGAYWQFSHLKASVPSSPSPQANDETTSIIQQIRQLVDLPAEDTPTIATVTDSTKVSSQPFFASSQDGDKVLVFSQSKKVILFRPSSNKIINISTVSEGSQSADLEASAASQPAVTTIVIRNGTTTQGLAAKLEQEVKTALPGSQITKENAATADYKTSLIAVVKEQKQPQAQSLAEKLKIPITSLPEKEKMPSGADIVLILGKDKSE